MCGINGRSNPRIDSITGKVVIGRAYEKTSVNSRRQNTGQVSISPRLQVDHLQS